MKWIIYIVLILILVGLAGVAGRIYLANRDLVSNTAKTIEELASAKAELVLTKDDLAKAKSDLAAKDSELVELENKMTVNGQSADELNRMFLETQARLASTTEEVEKLKQETKLIDQFKITLGSENVNLYAAIKKLGVGISNADIAKIAIADYNLGGADSDGDGLADAAEISLGTKKDNADSDGDGYNDKQEITGGFNPLGAGRLNLDNNFSNNQKGKILLQVQSKGEAWYVSLVDGKRYFLGIPANGVKAMEVLY